MTTPTTTQRPLIDRVESEYGAAMELYRDGIPTEAVRRMTIAQAQFADPRLLTDKDPNIRARAHLGSALSKAAGADYRGANTSLKAMLHTPGVAVETQVDILEKLARAARIHRSVGHTHRATYLDEIGAQLHRRVSPRALALESSRQQSARHGATAGEVGHLIGAGLRDVVEGRSEPVHVRNALYDINQDRAHAGRPAIDGLGGR